MMVYDLDDRQEELYYVTGAPEANWPDGLSFLPSSRDEMRDAFVGFHPIVSNANTWLRGNENPD